MGDWDFSSGFGDCGVKKVSVELGVCVCERERPVCLYIKLTYNNPQVTQTDSEIQEETFLGLPRLRCRRR